jgi:hypothetical protein
MEGQVSTNSGNQETLLRSARENQTASDILRLLARELPRLAQAVGTGTAIAATPDERPRKRKWTDASCGGDFSDDGPALPGRAQLESIVAAYFDHIHPWIPLIHQARFLANFAEPFNGGKSTVILHAMVIAAARFVPDLDVDSVKLLRARRNMILCIAMDTMSLHNLQALSILAWDDIGRGNASKAWSIIGSLSRTVEYLQLAQEQRLEEVHPLCQPYTSLPFTDDWTVIEERRRVFWNIFLLDRLCSVTMGWSSSLTSSDVLRRLPCDGVLWRKETPVTTPYFGIWDKSRGSLNQPIGFESVNSPSSARGDDVHSQVSGQVPVNNNQGSLPKPLVSSIGAFAYNIEATESMSRIMTHFLQQQVNFEVQGEVEAWLTRFKELDLRLVHWKMLLPQKWKANPNLIRQVHLMDPNLTTAHVTHNASMILLHQVIAYPPLYWRFRSKLPSGCSAEACLSAGTEISTISAKYISKSISGSPISGQFAFCLFLAGRVLLIHWQYTSEITLRPEFWSIVESLLVMSKRWVGACEYQPDQPNLFTKYASRLKELHSMCCVGNGFVINVMDYTLDISYSHDAPADPNAATGMPQQPQQTFVDPLSSFPDAGQSWSSTTCDQDLDAMSQFVLNQDFTDMDRVITFSDGSLFVTGD